MVNASVHVPNCCVLLFDVNQELSAVYIWTSVKTVSNGVMIFWLYPLNVKHIKQMMQLLYYFLVIKYRSDILKHWTSGYIENIYMYNQIKVQCICETRISNSLLFWLGIGTVFSSFLPTAVFFSRLISGQLKLMFVNL